MIQITEDQAYTACASRAFARRLSEEKKVELGAIIQKSRDIWFNELSAFDWLEAFRGHPPIGGTHASNMHTSSSELSATEQATAVATLSPKTARELADYNSKYEARFGHVFLIFAAGRTSDEILAELRRRYVMF
jgi:2-oxo-4-hydroxy-4-carboxy--5-ureidoimidazoline (OHCU) decarboxylase